MHNRSVLSCIVLALVCSAVRAPQIAAAGATSPQFAFWYEPWRSDTWHKLQPANTIIGIPPEAVADIHAHGGRAIRYVTFYQSTLGSDFLHDRADLERVGFHDARGYAPSVFGGKDNYVLCSNSSELARRVLLFLDETIARDQYDGLFIDNGYPGPAANEICDAKHEHRVPGKAGGAAYVSLLEELKERVKRKNPAFLVITNAGDPQAADALRDDNTSLSDVSDYVLWESYCYTSLTGSAHDQWSSCIAASGLFAAGAHARKLIVLSYPRNDREAIFSFAVAQVFGFSYAANLGEIDSNSGREGGHFGILLRDLPLNLGPATSSMLRDARSGVLRRSFRNGEVIINPASRVFLLKTAISGVLYSGDRHFAVKRNEKFIMAPQAAIIIVSNKRNPQPA